MLARFSQLFAVLYFLFLSMPALASLEQAQASFLKGDYDAAVKYCENAISSSAGAEVSRAYCLKGRTLLKENKLQEAGQAFRKVLSDFSGSNFCDEAQLGLGDILFAEGDSDAAIGEYRKVQEKYPQSRFISMALYKLGKSCLKSGRMQEARSYFQKLQQDYPLSFESKLIDELDNSEFAYSVQVGCFSKYENADGLVKKLKSADFDAYISEKEGRPVFYRVRVGRFTTQSKAASCAQALKSKGYKTKICP